ncbi:hypothetical protein ACAZ28_12555, partial [Akkermansia muciniphila]
VAAGIFFHQAPPVPQLAGLVRFLDGAILNLLLFLYFAKRNIWYMPPVRAVAPLLPPSSSVEN